MWGIVFANRIDLLFKMLTDVKTTPMLRILGTTRVAFTIGLVIEFLLMFQVEMKMYLGEDEGDNSLETNVFSIAICIETLVNMRTVYSKEHC